MAYDEEMHSRFLLNSGKPSIPLSIFGRVGSLDPKCNFCSTNRLAFSPISFRFSAFESAVR
jgi:hypothetical protein